MEINRIEAMEEQIITFSNNNGYIKFIKDNQGLQVLIGDNHIECRSKLEDTQKKELQWFLNQ